ncbi:MAG: hypothetical protein PF542_06475 [Nanoarchaeota archaeon]|nr:hypothetical protein [Nanoarchaeota archaeon]
MNKQEQKRRFAQAMILLSAKYKVKLSINWETGVLDFQGDLPPQGWSTLIGELTEMAREWNLKEV